MGGEGESLGTGWRLAGGARKGARVSSADGEAGGAAEC